MENKEHYLKAFLIAGLVSGLLSSLPIISIGNCCCLWMLFGGGLSAWLLSGSAKKSVRIGESALVGLFSGLLAGMIFSFTETIKRIINPDQFQLVIETMRSRGVSLPPEMEDYLSQALNLIAHPGLFLIGLLFFYLLIFGIMSITGAVIGFSIFEPRFALKRKVKQDSSGEAISQPLVELSKTQEIIKEGQMKKTDLYFPRKEKEGE